MATTTRPKPGPAMSDFTCEELIDPALSRTGVASRRSPRARRAALRIVAVALIATLMLSLFASAASATGSVWSASGNYVDGGSDDKVSVMLWGDSLAFESQEYFLARFEGSERVRANARTFGGTATCDFLADMTAVARSTELDIAVLEFSGNSFTPCMTDAAGARYQDQGLLTKYEYDTRRAISVLTRSGTRVYLADSPVNRDEVVGGIGARLRALYASIAAEYDNVEYVAAGAAVLTDGRFVETQPCLSFEGAAHGCVDGRISVRAPDGAHFCPGSGPAMAGVTSVCPRWSSGAYRYADAMAQAVITDLAPPLRQAITTGK